MPLCVVLTEAFKWEPNMLALGDEMSFGTFHSCLSTVCNYPAAFNTCSSHRETRPRACRITEGWGALSYY